VVHLYDDPSARPVRPVAMERLVVTPPRYQLPAPSEVLRRPPQPAVVGLHSTSHSGPPVALPPHPELPTYPSAHGFRPDPDDAIDRQIAAVVPHFQGASLDRMTILGWLEAQRMVRATERNMNDPERHAGERFVPDGSDLFRSFFGGARSVDMVGHGWVSIRFDREKFGPNDPVTVFLVVDKAEAEAVASGRDVWAIDLRLSKTFEGTVHELAERIRRTFAERSAMQHEEEIAPEQLRPASRALARATVAIQQPHVAPPPAPSSRPKLPAPSTLARRPPPPAVVHLYDPRRRAPEEAPAEPPSVLDLGSRQPITEPEEKVVQAVLANVASQEATTAPGWVPVRLDRNTSNGWLRVVLRRVGLPPKLAAAYSKTTDAVLQRVITPEFLAAIDKIRKGPSGWSADYQSARPPVQKYDDSPAWVFVRDLRVIDRSRAGNATVDRGAAKFLEVAGYKAPAKQREVLDQHFRLVLDALQHGNPVAPEVLADYPGLAELYADVRTSARTAAELAAEREAKRRALDNTPILLLNS
jgi:hypothetical protein